MFTLILLVALLLILFISPASFLSHYIKKDIEEVGK